MEARIYELKVLLVEDELIIRESFRSLLKRRVKKFITAKDGLDGLEKFKQERPDIVMTDIKMPKMDGLEMIAKIKEIDPDTIIVVISAHSETEYLLDAIEVGVNNFLIKPVDKPKLYNLLAKYVQDLKLKSELEQKRLEKEQTELQLREKEKKYRRVFEEFQDLYFEIDLSGYILTVTPYIQKLTGYTPQEVEGKNIELFYKNRASKEKFLDKLVRNSNVENFETELQRKDGSKIIVSINAHLIYDRNGNIKNITGVIHDITARKKIEEELSQSLKLQQLYSQVTQIFIGSENWEYSVEKALQIMGETVQVSRVLLFEDSQNGYQTTNSFEWSSDEIETNANQLQGMHFSQTPAWKALLQEEGEILCNDINKLPKDIRENLKPLAVRSLLVCPLVIRNEVKGSLAFVECGYDKNWTKDEREMLHTISNIIANFIEKNRAYERLMISEEKFRVIGSAANDAIIMADSKGNINFWNSAAEKIFGYSQTEVIGKNVHTLIAPERYMQEYKKNWFHFQNTGEGKAIGTTLELSALRRNGEEFPVELSLSSVKVQDEWNAVGILRDITQRKEAEKKIKLQNENLLRELEIAASVQQYLLPNWLVYEKEIVFSSAYTPSSEVGGDIFDIKKISSSRYVLYVGDISGHGVQAALLMTAVRSTISMLVDNMKTRLEPYKIVNELNRIISKELFHRNYLTMVFAIIDLEKGVVKYFNAGHPPIIKYDIKRRETELLPPKGGVPIGWEKDYHYRREDQDSFAIDENQLFFLYTDGIFECEDKQGNQLGLQGLREFLNKNIVNANSLIIPHKIKHKLIEKEYDVSSDDFTLVCFRKLLPSDNKKKSYLIRSLVENIGEVAIHCENFIKSKFNDPDFAAKVEIVVDEFLNEVIKRGYVNKAESLIMLQLETEDILKLTFWDKGDDWGIPINKGKADEMGFQLIFTIANNIVRNRYGDINETIIEMPYEKK